LQIGFAAETDNLVEEARRKMKSKNCDMIVANLVNRDGLGFDSDRNEVEILTRAGQIFHAGPADKREIAGHILDRVATLRLSVREVAGSV
jgi:phosphopantothenoylcysteine decarboxylase/phosphopantothenate--cysteine ligase